MTRTNSTSDAIIRSLSSIKSSPHAGRMPALPALSTKKYAKYAKAIHQIWAEMKR
jgi:hypothetical protein